MLEKLREIVAEELKKLDGVLALRAGEGGVAPHLFTEPKDLGGLALSPFYALAEPLRIIQKAYPQAHLGVVGRGCDERHLVEFAKRNQIDLGRVRLIGVACTPEEAEACRCTQPYPREILVGERAPGVVDELAAAFLTKTTEERLDFWHHEFAKCLKCYGCRNICPQCFCEECTLEEGLWVERGELPPPFPTFHLIRAMHTAGKCVGCGECERACPARIPLTTLYSLIRQDVEELFGYQAGRSVEDKPPLLLDTEM